MNFRKLKTIYLSTIILATPLCTQAQTTISNDSLTVQFSSWNEKNTEQTYHLKADKGKQSLLVFNESMIRMQNAAIEFDVVPKNSDSKFGILARYIDEQQWCYIGCDVTSDILAYSHWYAVRPERVHYLESEIMSSLPDAAPKSMRMPGQKVEVASDISKFYKNYKRHVRIEYVGNTVSIYLDGEKVTHTATDLLVNQEGLMGFRAHDGADVEISNVRITPVVEPRTTLAKASSLRLSSDKMQVTFSQNYPTVYDYKLKAGGITVRGAMAITNAFVVNGKSYTATTKAKQIGNTIVYQSEIPEINVGLTTEFALDGMILQMKVTKIEERGDVKVKTIAFPNHDIVSLNNLDSNAKLSTAIDVHDDKFMKLKDRSADRAPHYAAIAIMNNDKVAVTIDNNSIYNAKQILYRTAKVGIEHYTSLYSNEWIYRGINNEVLPLPEMKVIFATDNNGDKVIDWQDAAYSLAQVYPEPYGADLMRNSYATITMNFASGGQYPFVRQLDNIKKFHQATDGFGQMLELKGYQSEGHDSAHPDYAGNYNRRAGGLKDLQLLTQKAKDYNAHIGVHINHSEAYPEAKAYDNEIMTDLKGWAWLDQAYLINKEADIKRGTFVQRLDQMKKDLPHLAFVYIDTYREHRSIAHLTGQQFNKNGWPIWTEDPEVFFREGVWVHHHSDSRSMIARFVHHKFRDAYINHPTLLGGYSRGAAIGFMGWQKGKDFNLVLHNFFTQQLPYRYLMHHGLMKVDDKQATFEHNLVSESVNGVNKLTQDGNIIKQGENIFIPWNPVKKDKIYHYNSQGGKSIWTLPNEWKSSTTIALYKLTSQGREWIQDITVSPNREVTIDALPKQGYVLHPNKVTDSQAMAWGEGGNIINPGFDGGLSGWSDQNVKSVKVITSDYGQDVLQMTETSDVKQSVTLAAGQYMLSVWCKVEGKGKATLSIGDQWYSITESNVINYTDNTDRFKTNFQRIKVPYLHQGGSVDIRLAFQGIDEGSSAQFDDVRLVTQKPIGAISHAYYEDFEDVDEGWGPFIASKPSLYKTHLSELHEGYTDDTIEGNFSLKTWQEGNGEVYRTSPSMIRFKPNTMYKITFDYKSTEKDVYRLVVRSAKSNTIFNNTILVDHPLDGASTFSAEFKTGNSDDFYIATMKQGNGILVIDNFAIDGDLDK